MFLGFTVIINTQKLIHIHNFTFHSTKISCINTSFKLAKIVSCNSKLLHKISHTFTVIFLKYNSLNIRKYVSVSTARKLLISTQSAVVSYGTLRSYLSLFTTAHISTCCRKQQRPRLLERTVVVHIINETYKVRVTKY